MKVIDTNIDDVKILEPTVYDDSRGFFFESFNKAKFEEAVGKKIKFSQDNHSCSEKGVLRGLHYQLPPHAQGKLVRVISGEVFDVAVDIRASSPTLGKWVGITLSAENKRQLWIPQGFAHAFLVTSERAEFLYKTTDYWYRDLERTILWNDLTLGISWPIDTQPILSDKDSSGMAFDLAEIFP